MGFGGGLVGGIIGGIIGGLPGAIIGAGIGAFATRSNGSRETSPTAQNEALLSLFRCLGKLAKSDGIVSREEADFVQSLLHELNIEKSIRSQAIAAFSEGKTSPLSFGELVRQMAERHDPRSYEALLNVFCIMALADGVVSDAERTILHDAERILRLPGYVDAFFRNNTGNSRQRQQEASVPGGGDDLADAYQVLGITATATDDEVKKAWRKKAIEFHPDKIQGKGLPEEFVKFANEQTRKINDAYGRICKARGI